MGLLDIFKVNSFKARIGQLENENNELKARFNEIGGDDYLSLKQKNQEYSQQIILQQNKLNSITEEVKSKSDECQKIDKQLNTHTKKLRREKELYKAMVYALDHYSNYNPVGFHGLLNNIEFEEAEEYAPSITLNLHSMDIKALRSAYRENDKQIDDLLKAYSARYTTKSNKAIYQLMVIALRSELQNILSNLKYEKLDDAVAHVKDVTAKYLKIAGDGNQSIAGTLQKFIGEIEYLFINAVKIEYNYYVKKEQAKQEQAAIREQMRQEAEERKALAEEKKRIEAEEKKYNDELDKLAEKMKSASEKEVEALKARILELQGNLAEVSLQKEKIATLANGKAGNVYIISNIGAFGENVFKIGMTRRMNPQERVDELGSASVPFKFDVHSFIFSNDAVGLESELHNRLNDCRVNKVNLRKEFFKVTLDELEELVTEIDPTAEFKRIVSSEEYKQSISSNENYTSEYYDEYEDDEGEI